MDLCVTSPGKSGSRPTVLQLRQLWAFKGLVLGNLFLNSFLILQGKSHDARYYLYDLWIKFKEVSDSGKISSFCQTKQWWPAAFPLATWSWATRSLLPWGLDNSCPIPAALEVINFLLYLLPNSIPVAREAEDLTHKLYDLCYGLNNSYLNLFSMSSLVMIFRSSCFTFCLSKDPERGPNPIF
jgi:hypothetical protein